MMAAKPFFRRDTITASAQQPERIVPVPGGDIMGEPIVAAVGSLYTDRGRNRRTSGGSKTAPEDQLAEFDNGSPGLFGTLLDLEAALVSELPYYVAFDGQSGDRANAAQILWDHVFVGPDGEDAQELRRRAVRALRKSGRFAVVHEDTDTGLRIWTSGVKALRPQKRDGVAGWAVGSKPEARARTTPRWVPDSQVREMWTAHDEDPLSPWTPYFRVIDALSLMQSNSRVLTRSANQYLAGSRFVWIEGSPEDLVRRQTNGSNRDTPMGMTIRGMLGAMEANLLDVSEVNSRSAVPIPIVSTKEPKIIDATQRLDPTFLTALEAARKEFALATPWPTMFVTEGTGAGNRWSEFLQDRQANRHVVFPIAAQLAALLTVGCLHPLLKASNVTDWHRYAVMFDRLGTDNKEVPSPEAAAQAWRDGIISRRRYAEIIGLDPDEMMKIPEGVSDYEVWAAQILRPQSGTRSTAVPGAVAEPAAPVAASLSVVSDPISDWWVA